MAKPRVLCLRAPGTNCDRDTAFAFEQAGAVAEVHHIQAVLREPNKLAQFQILCVPGGFSYGDDLSAGRILGHQMQVHLGDVMQGFKDRGALILGICNGFQVLTKTGLLLPIDPQQGPAATLTLNRSGRYEDRWVHLHVTPGKSVFLQGITQMYLPVAHAEGRFTARNASTLLNLERGGQLVMQYVPTPGGDPRGEVAYPANPNGAQLNVAGICDETGRVFGLMPHPERHIDVTHHPRWTRGEGKPGGDGLKLFQNAVAYFQ